jgi:hypothetical protein
MLMVMPMVMPMAMLVVMLVVMLIVMLIVMPTILPEALLGSSQQVVLIVDGILALVAAVVVLALGDIKKKKRFARGGELDSKGWGLHAYLSLVHRWLFHLNLLSLPFPLAS